MNLKINNGIIENNPFYKNVGHSECALWILQNEGKVKKRIQKTLSKMGHGNFEIDECYDYMTYYFIEFSHNEFDKEYFLKKKMKEKLENLEEGVDVIDLEEIDKLENSEYKLEYYVLNRVHNAAMGYVRNLNKLKNMKRFIDSNELDEQEHTSYYNISIDEVSSQVYLNDRFSDNNPEIICEYAELQDILDYDLDIYNEEFNRSGLKGFSTRKFVEALFLMDLNDEEEIAEVLGISVNKLSNYIEGFKALMKNETGLGGKYRNLMMSIKQLVEGKKNGWEPRLKLEMEGIILKSKNK